MQEDSSFSSRKRRFEKRRVNTKMINWLAVIGTVLLITIISLFIFGNNDDSDEVAESNENKEEMPSEVEEDEPTDVEDNENVEDSIVIEVIEDEEPLEENEATESDAELTISNVESEDTNVREAYEGNWQPVGTEQTGPHTIQFNKESVDWKEMLIAVEHATNVPVEEQTVHWIGRAGDQQVQATISPNSNQAEIYRVHLQWIDNQGWQPTLVEELIENDTPSAQRQTETDEAEDIEG